MDVQSVLFMFVGGLGIFLFGIKYLGDGLQKIAGDGLRDLLDRFTTNPIMGVISGTIVTILLQTSTGTTVLTIGLVNAGFMTLKQAIGVIIEQTLVLRLPLLLLVLKFQHMRYLL